MQMSTFGPLLSDILSFHRERNSTFKMEGINERLQSRRHEDLIQDKERLVVSVSQILKDINCMLENKIRHRIFEYLCVEIGCFWDAGFVQKSSSPFELCHLDAAFTLDKEMDSTDRCEEKAVRFQDCKKRTLKKPFRVLPYESVILCEADLKDCIVVLLFWGDAGIVEHNNRVGITFESFHLHHHDFTKKNTNRNLKRFMTDVENFTKTHSLYLHDNGGNREIEGYSPHTRVYVTSRDTSLAFSALPTWKDTLISPNILLEKNEELTVSKLDCCWAGRLRKRCN